MEYDGAVYRHCLNYLVTNRSLDWLLAYRYAQHHIMPEPGGLNDQWEIDLVAFGIIAAEIESLEAYYNERRQGRTGN